MTKSYRQLHAAYRVVSDVLSTGPDPVLSKQVLLNRLVDRLACFRGVCTVYSDFTAEGRTRLIDVAFVGAADAVPFERGRNGPECVNPRINPLTDRCARHGANLAVLHRRTLMSDADWERSGIGPGVRAAGLGELMCAWYRRSDGSAFTLGLFKSIGGGAFTLGDFRLVRMVLKELRRLSESGRFLDRPAGIDPPGLTVREKQVLALLLKGCSGKEVASHLGISCLTVAGYVKDLYRQFEVHSRSELLAKFIRR